VALQTHWTFPVARRLFPESCLVLFSVRDGQIYPTREVLFSVSVVTLTLLVLKVTLILSLTLTLTLLTLTITSAGLLYLGP